MKLVTYLVAPQKNKKLKFISFSFGNFMGVTEIMLYTITFVNPHAIESRLDILFLSC